MTDVPIGAIMTDVMSMTTVTMIVEVYAEQEERMIEGVIMDERTTDEAFMVVIERTIDEAITEEEELEEGIRVEDIEIGMDITAGPELILNWTESLTMEMII